MSDSTPPVKKNGNTGLVVIALLLLLAAAGGVAWKLSSGSSQEVVEERVKLPPPAETSAPNEDALPPPPSEEDLAAAPSASTASTATVKSGGPAGCAAACEGSAGANLQSALRARGGQARGCYERALRTNAQLTGKMTVQIKLSPTGSVCSASIQGDTLGDPGVSSCVLSNFRSGVYPAPQGGCVTTEVPLNFVAKQ